LASVRLRTIDEQVIHLFAMVSEGVAAATAAFLEGDLEMARKLVAGDQSLDSLQSSIEELVERQLASGPPTDQEELRRLVSVLRIAPELERSGDLVEHIALRTPQRLAERMTPRARGMVEAMGHIAAEMWRTTASAYADRDAGAAQRLRARDDDLDDLHVQRSAELATIGTSIADAIELGLVARFFERLGDHAVNVARRIDGLVPRADVAAI